LNATLHFALQPMQHALAVIRDQQVFASLAKITLGIEKI